jgi:two-component system chemotaxis response regulator CheY
MSHPLKILIVEDSPAMRQLLSIAVRRRAHVEVVEAIDGLDALKKLASTRFDLLFIDLNMPVLDGMKLIKRVREGESGDPRVRICVVTTESALATEEQARALGADFYLRKPLNRRDVERVLAEAFPG